MPATTMVNQPSFDIKPHPAFNAIPKGQTGLYVWHVVKLDLEKVPDNQIGSFFSGDCYLILAVRDAKMTDLRIHFWIGSQSSIDEGAVAAMMAVGLDDYFGGSPVQTREVQGAESEMFMHYFAERKLALRYMDGGVESGLRHVTKRQHRNALYQVKGSTKACRIAEVPIAWQSFNEGDTFVFDLGAVIFVWKGKHSRTSESYAGAQFANQLRSERGPKNCIVLVTEDGREETELLETYLELWNQHLPWAKRQVKPSSEGGNDQEAVLEQTSRLKLFCCKEQNGATAVQEVKNGPLFYSDLKSDDAYIVDNGPAGVFAWIGKKASPQERRFAMNSASEFVRSNKYPASTRIQRVIDGAETAEFRALFAKWPVASAGGNYSFNRIAKPGPEEKFDAASLHANRKMAAEVQMLDNGDGAKEIYRVERSQSKTKAGYELVKQDKAVLYGGDCYVVVYTTDSKQSVIYFWIGRNSSQDERGAAAALVIELDNTRFHGQAIQVRVSQSKEPRHFMAIFGGLLTTFEGGKAGWGKDEQDKVIGDTFLLQIHCESRIDRKVIQVPLTAESLNSSDAFVVVLQGKRSFVWQGKGCQTAELELAVKVAKTCLPNVEPVVVSEGSETSEFWSALGGQKPYASSKVLADANMSESFCPRLFQVTNRSGRCAVHEVAEFDQDDLVVDDVMLLDANDSIYVWIGVESNKQERDFALRAAADYLKADPKGRDENLPIFVVKQGFEPPSFTGFFTAWDAKLWSGSKTYEQLKAEFGREAKDLALTAQQITDMKLALGGEPDFNKVNKFPLEKLTVPADQLPAEVDVAHREKYLTADEFQRVFGLPYEQFAAKPAWQRAKLKKTANLF